MGPEMMQRWDQAAASAPALSPTTPPGSSSRASPAAFSTVHVGGKEIKARAVILAMGAEPKKLGVPGEEELAARGISHWATCDAAFFRGKQTIVVGGGDTAMEDATFLSKFADRVGIVHWRPEFRASAIMLDRARQTDNIDLVTPYVVKSFDAGDDGAPSR